MFTELRRLGAAIRHSRRTRLSVRAIEALPHEIQKDIGWPVSRSADLTLLRLATLGNLR